MLHADAVRGVLGTDQGDGLVGTEGFFADLAMQVPACGN